MTASSLELGSTRTAPLRVVFLGDLMLGRGVAESMEELGPDRAFSQVEPILRGADLVIGNLECAITPSGHLFPGEPKAFYFRASPQAAWALSQANVGLVSLANNHALDLGTEGLLDTLGLLDVRGISHVGGGVDLASARTPALREARGERFGMVAYCDHQRDFAAGEDAPGIAYLDLNDDTGVVRTLEEDLEKLRERGVVWPVLSLHWGYNMVLRPPPNFVRLAHRAVEMGFAAVYGHSSHVFQGLEFYRGCPILYGAGDFVDDYAIDPSLRNDLQVLWQLEIEGGRWVRAELLPVRIQDCRVGPAVGRDAAFVLKRAELLCGDLGNSGRLVRGKWVVETRPNGSEGRRDLPVGTSAGAAASGLAH